MMLLNLSRPTVSRGNKMNNIDVVYTMWSNLKKTPSMVVNRINKTKGESFPEREERDSEERQEQKKLLKQQQQMDKEDMKRKAEEAELRTYSCLHKEENMSTNYDDGNDSDDFM
ncbi:CCDC25.2 family protein [Megaselia abdita]